jgi:hypothetical protein
MGTTLCLEPFRENFIALRNKNVLNFGGSSHKSEFKVGYLIEGLMKSYTKNID